MSRVAKIVQIFLTVFFLAVAGLIYIINRDFDEALKPVIDPARYAEIRSKFEDSLLVKHFPIDIPVDAKNVDLYYLPGFMQGGTFLQLRMQLSPEKIKRIEAEFLEKAKRKYIPGAKSNSPTEENSPIGTKVEYNYKSYTGGANGENFPSNYEILVLEDTRGAPKYDWNHSDIYGVAIDPATSEVVYWLEDW
jgi:hypothetical protein